MNTSEKRYLVPSVGPVIPLFGERSKRARPRKLNPVKTYEKGVRQRKKTLPEQPQEEVVEHREPVEEQAQRKRQILEQLKGLVECYEELKKSLPGTTSAVEEPEVNVLDVEEERLRLMRSKLVGQSKALDLEPVSPSYVRQPFAVIQAVRPMTVGNGPPNPALNRLLAMPRRHRRYLPDPFALSQNGKFFYPGTIQPLKAGKRSLMVGT
eukprot:RCo044920